MQRIIDTTGSAVPDAIGFTQRQLDEGWRLTHMSTLSDGNRAIAGIIVVVLERDDDPAA